MDKNLQAKIIRDDFWNVIDENILNADPYHINGGYVKFNNNESKIKLENYLLTTLDILESFLDYDIFYVYYSVSEIAKLLLPKDVIEKINVNLSTINTYEYYYSYILFIFRVIYDYQYYLSNDYKKFYSDLLSLNNITDSRQLKIFNSFTKYAFLTIVKFISKNQNVINHDTIIELFSYRVDKINNYNNNSKMPEFIELNILFDYAKISKKKLKDYYSIINSTKEMKNAFNFFWVYDLDSKHVYQGNYGFYNMIKTGSILVLKYDNNINQNIDPFFLNFYDTAINSNKINYNKYKIFSQLQSLSNKTNFNIENNLNQEESKIIHGAAVGDIFISVKLNDDGKLILDPNDYIIATTDENHGNYVVYSKLNKDKFILHQTGHSSYDGTKGTLFLKKEEEITSQQSQTLSSVKQETSQPQLTTSPSSSNNPVASPLKNQPQTSSSDKPQPLPRKSLQGKQETSQSQPQTQPQTFSQVKQETPPLTSLLGKQETQKKQLEDEDEVDDEFIISLFMEFINNIRLDDCNDFNENISTLNGLLVENISIKEIDIDLYTNYKSINVTINNLLVLLKDEIDYNINYNNLGYIVYLLIISFGIYGRKRLKTLTTEDNKQGLDIINKNMIIIVKLMEYIKIIYKIFNNKIKSLNINTELTKIDDDKIKDLVEENIKLMKNIDEEDEDDPYDPNEKSNPIIYFKFTENIMNYLNEIKELSLNDPENIFSEFIK